ncbi:MAG TPA: NAD(P)/FAD-dependent oxidoreductase [Verrucomicrobiales bacterium]|nr:NAD(P)/FAD-dependent oxidoreductase [Verrucomicrobiales bacterium]
MSSHSDPVRVLVLGGGFGGLAFCKELRDSRFAITLIDRQNHHLFQPLLYQVATGGLSAPEIAQPIRSILRKQRNVTVLMEEVRGIDLAQRSVQLENRTLEYDYLIIALGARTGYFGHPEWEPHAPGLKTLEDARRIRTDALGCYEAAESSTDPAERARLLTSVVVGGGPTGVEMAGALAELSRKVLARDFRRIQPHEARVYLIEAGPRLLTTFDKSLSDYGRERLEKMGVTVKLATPVQNITPGEVTLPNETIRAATIVWAAGVEAVPLTRQLGVPIDRAGRIQVLPDLSVPGHENVFAVGDIAILTDAKGQRVPGVCPAAIQMGRHAARTIRNEVRHRQRYLVPVPRAPFAYFDKGNMATIGRNAAVAETSYMKARGLLAWLMWLFIHLLFLVGLRNRLFVFMQWIYSYFTWRRGARIITKK